MNRPATPEKESKIYQNFTICQLKQSVQVRIKELPTDAFLPDSEKAYTLPAGSSVTVFDGQTLNLTGTNYPLSIDNIGYRIEGELEFTLYESIGEILGDASDLRLRRHTNFRPVVPASHDPNTLFLQWTIVALKESATYRGVGTVPQGKLFAIQSKAKTPMGQNIVRNTLIDKAVYDIRPVKKISRMLKVRNSSNMLVLHEHLQRMP